MPQITTYLIAFILTGFLSGTGPFSSLSAQPTDSLSLFDHLYVGEEHLPKIILTTDTRQLIRRKLQEEYQPSLITIEGIDTEPVVMNIKIRARGNVRKQVCYYPPIRLNFKKSDLEEMGFSSSDKIKLVMQCGNGSKNESYLLREYLAYRLYNLLTPYSFKVQLIQLEIQDSEGKVKPVEMYAFIIEPEKVLEARTNGIVVEREKANPHMFEDQPFKEMSVFQYMIGNTDWSSVNLHNLVMLKIPKNTKLLPIPYDFDYAGFVDTHYAVPAEEVPIDDVRQRYYAGLDCSEAEIEKLLDRFKALEPEMLKICDDFSFLDERNRKEVHLYLEDFFKMLDQPNYFTRVFGN